MTARKQTPEGAIKSAVKQYLRYTGWYVVHIQGGPLSHRGISDLIAIKSNVVAFVEIKTPKTNQSADQKDFEQCVKDKGGNYYVVRSIEDAEAMARALGFTGR